MSRKLLPYEHDLIAALGISKDDYLEFVALQQIYSDPKKDTVLDIRNEPVSIILAVIGIIFQVVSALLTPKPEIPNLGGGERQSREQRFSPRFGFNSTQELAKYGDAVPLVYTDRSTTGNVNGGVRLIGSLLWSAVRSYGSNQFLQMLMMLSGGPITSIDPAKSAFGQTVITDLVAQNKWIYFNDNSTGRLRWADELNANAATDPTKYGGANDNPYRLQPTVNNTRVDGFSQAYSPSSSNIFGGYSPVPINVMLYLRNEAGDKKSTSVGITLEGLAAWASGRLGVIKVGATMRLTFASTANPPTGVKFADDLARAAIDARRGLASVFDDAGIFKLGSARFRVSKVNGTTTDEGQFSIDFTCTEAGRAPSIPYSYDEYTDAHEEYKLSPAYVEGSELEKTLCALDGRGDKNPITFRRTKGINTLPANQRFAVLNAGDLIQSKKIYRYEPVKLSRPNQNFTPKFTFVRDITKDELATLKNYQDIIADATDKNGKDKENKSDDDLFYLKAITRIEEASYNTISPCNIVDIALKAQVFCRISGRQQRYGTGNRAGYAASDNGINHRVAMFLIKYRPSGGTWETAPAIFAVRRAADQDNYVYIKFHGGTQAEHWQLRFEPVVDPLAEIMEHKTLRKSNGRVCYCYLNNSGSAATLALNASQNLYFTGMIRDSQVSGLPPFNTSPKGTNEWDWFNLDADTQLQTSFERGPEFTITAVSEQLIEKFDTRLYNNLALVGFNIFSGKSLQDMRSFSVFVTKGKPVRRLRTSGRDESGNSWGSSEYRYYPANPDGPTSFAPDIFLDTVLDRVDGIGNFAEIGGVDIKQLAIAKRFCRANKFYMDGLIADRQSWREFWVNAAPFSLLEFARVGGRETLIPAVPFDETTGLIHRHVNISALFNEGNILSDSYKEEYLDYDANVQDIIATIIYRELDSNATFAVNRSVSIQRRDSTEADAIRQSFDASAFITTENQAILFGKFLCNIRRHVRTAISFKTFPTTSPVSPGSYIYVDIGQNNWDGIKTGVIGPGGRLNTPLDNTIKNGKYSFLLYTSGTSPYSVEAIVSDNAAPSLAAREGCLFVLGTKVHTRRVFRVNEVQMDEEGEVTVRATIAPCDSGDNSLIADFEDDLFTVRR